MGQESKDGPGVRAHWPGHELARDSFQARIRESAGRSHAAEPEGAGLHNPALTIKPEAKP